MSTEEPEEPDQSAADPQHDESGLELARLITKSLAGAARAGKGPGPGGRGGRGRPGPRIGRISKAKTSGAHPDDRDPQALGSMVGRLVDDLGWDTDLRVHAVFGRWQELVGDEIAEHCRPESFADARLVVRTESTAWATQLRFLAPTVLRRLNAELGDNTVTFLEVVGPLTPSWKKGRFSAPGRGPRDTYG